MLTINSTAKLSALAFAALAFSTPLMAADNAAGNAAQPKAAAGQAAGQPAANPAGKAAAPGQTVAAECAKLTEPKAKDECVKKAQTAAGNPTGSTSAAPPAKKTN